MKLGKTDKTIWLKSHIVQDRHQHVKSQFHNIMKTRAWGTKSLDFCVFSIIWSNHVLL